MAELRGQADEGVSFPLAWRMRQVGRDAATVSRRSAYRHTGARSRPPGARIARRTTDEGRRSVEAHVGATRSSAFPTVAAKKVQVIVEKPGGWCVWPETILRNFLPKRGLYYACAAPDRGAISRHGHANAPQTPVTMREWCIEQDRRVWDNRRPPGGGINHR